MISLSSILIFFTIIANFLPYLDAILLLLPVLLAVAFVTIVERKQLAAHQRRIGPNSVGYFGILQPSPKSAGGII